MDDDGYDGVSVGLGGGRGKEEKKRGIGERERALLRRTEQKYGKKKQKKRKLCYKSPRFNHPNPPLSDIACFACFDVREKTRRRRNPQDPIPADRLHLPPPPNLLFFPPTLRLTFFPPFPFLLFLVVGTIK